MNQTFRSARSVKDAQQRLKGRVVALNRAQDLLARTNWQSASIAEVVESALAAHRTGEGRFRIDGPDFALPAKQALSLSLVLYELATNAAKYGCAFGRARLGQSGLEHRGQGGRRDVSPDLAGG
jgi:two-component sensor histidine kinase